MIDGVTKTVMYSKQVSDMLYKKLMEDNPNHTSTHQVVDISDSEKIDAVCIDCIDYQNPKLFTKK